MTLILTGEISADIVVLRCRGRILGGDEGTVFRERVRSMFSEAPKIVIDLCGVDHIDSEGLGILVGLCLSARNRGGDIKLASPRKHVQEALDRTRLSTLLSIYNTYEEALAAFPKHLV